MGGTDHICRACGSPAKFLWQGQLLNIPIKYFECDVCGYVQTEKPYWLERAYSDVINESDTGIMVRNLANARIVLATLMVLGKLSGRVVDAAGGYGILVRLLRDYGVNAFWSDPYCQNLLARGFAHNGEAADLVTAFEVFEHFVNPAEELDRLLAIAPSVLISTELLPSPVPEQDDWWYYGKDHGQHIGFFKVKTLEMLATKKGKCLSTDGRSYHLLTDHPINRPLWRAAIKANKLVSLPLKKVLSSLTWPDHLRMVSKGR